MSDIAQILNYYRACYQADFRGLQLLDFFNKKVEHPHVLEKANLLEGKWLKVPVNTKWAKEVKATLSIYAKEKALYCFPFFLTGKTSILGKSQTVFAPLLLIPVSLTLEDEVYYLEAVMDKCSLNPAAVDFLKANTQLSNPAFLQLIDRLPRSFIRFDEQHLIEDILKQILPDIQLNHFEQYPEVFDKARLETFNNKKSAEQCHLLPAIGLGLIKKPQGSLGIINELEQMANEGDFSDALQGLFTNKIATAKASSVNTVIAPVTLSTNQQKVIETAEQYPISLVNGPPGTGKSFTIAALATHFSASGQSVLIASKSNQAVEVIANKIESDFGLKDLIVRAGRTDYKYALQKKLTQFRYGTGLKRVLPPEVKMIKIEVERLIKKIESHQKKLQTQENTEIKRGLFLEHFDSYWFKGIRLKYLTNQVQKSAKYWDLIFKLEELLLRKNKQMHELIERNFQCYLYQAYRYSRKELKDLTSALQARTGNRKEKYFDKVNFSKILKALPIWLVNSNDIYQVLPLNKELFDLLIIDEASQCDIASSLPLLHRAKKVVVVGDPKQLRHVSFLSQRQQQTFRQQFSLEQCDTELLNYRDRSLLDLVADQSNQPDQIHFLDEHYRSLPDIIYFSNQHFYNRGLRIMTATPQTVAKQNVFIERSYGERHASGYNKMECDAVLMKVTQLIHKEALFAPNLCQTIGILSPFRAQVDYIRKVVGEQLMPAQIERHQIIIGTPHAFQGEERDVMFLSFAVDINSHPSSFLYLNKEDVFNVSITRARSLQYLYLSIDSKDLKENNLLAHYLKSIEGGKGRQAAIAKTDIHDQFLNQITQLLHRWEIKTLYTAYPIAGLELDLVVIHQGQTFCIDLIGYPGAFEQAFPIDRWKILERLGVRTFALPYSNWRIEPKVCQKALKAFLNIPQS